MSTFPFRPASVKKVPPFAHVPGVCAYCGTGDCYDLDYCRADWLACQSALPVTTPTLGVLLLGGYIPEDEREPSEPDYERGMEVCQ